MYHNSSLMNVSVLLKYNLQAVIIQKYIIHLHIVWGARPHVRTFKEF